MKSLFGNGKSEPELSNACQNALIGTIFFVSSVQPMIDCDLLIEDGSIIVVTMQSAAH